VRSETNHPSPSCKGRTFGFTFRHSPEASGKCEASLKRPVILRSNKHLMQLPLRLFSTTSILQAWPNLKHAGIRIGPQWQRLNQLQCLICLINLTSTIKSAQTSKTVTHTMEALWRGFCSTITKWNQIMLCHYIHRAASPSSTVDFQNQHLFIYSDLGHTAHKWHSLI